MFKAIDISTSGLVAQRQRMNTIAGNIANVNTTIDENGNVTPFQRRFVTFAAADSQPLADTRGVGVTYQVEIDQQEPRLVHDPGHKHADENGMVHYPNINLITEFVNAMGASRAYQANIAAIESSKEMAQAALRILA